MKIKYYKITCNEIDIYEYLRNYIWNNISNPNKVWNNFINSNENKCLKKLNFNTDKSKEYKLFFTKKGYDIFNKKTLSIIKKWIDEKNIKSELIEINENDIVYKDEHQIVIEVNKAREFCIKVKELAQKYNLPFFLVTEGVSITSNNNCEAVKYERKSHIELEKQNNLNPYEDWGKNNE